MPRREDTRITKSDVMTITDKITGRKQISIMDGQRDK